MHLSLYLNVKTHRPENQRYSTFTALSTIVERSNNTEKAYTTYNCFTTSSQASFLFASFIATRPVLYLKSRHILQG
jgi:hypothetical protein